MTDRKLQAEIKIELANFSLISAETMLVERYMEWHVNGHEWHVWHVNGHPEDKSV